MKPNVISWVPFLKPVNVVIKCWHSLVFYRNIPSLQVNRSVAVNNKNITHELPKELILFQENLKTAQNYSLVPSLFDKTTFLLDLVEHAAVACTGNLVPLKAGCRASAGSNQLSLIFEWPSVIQHKERELTN